MTSSRLHPTSAASRFTIGWSAVATLASAKPKASTATIKRVGKAVGVWSPGSTDDTRGEVSGAAADPAGRVGRRRLRQHAGDVDAAVRRADAVEPAEGGRHAHRA